jgi:hypothetical protein
MHKPQTEYREQLSVATVKDTNIFECFGCVTVDAGR